MGQGVTVFSGQFTQQEPLNGEAIAAAVDVMQSGRLHRYNVVEGEVSDTAALEVEFARYLGRKYCLAVASGGYAIGCALRAHGIKPGDAVLTNAFTLAPVPGAIEAVGARSIFVETRDDLTIDLDHLERRIKDTGARVLLLSHMRGYQPNMEAVMAIADGQGVTVIEDCAHTMGSHVNGEPSGTHGASACFSTQTYKHINSGEGGFLVTDDPEVAARAIILSGSYMLYGRHDAAPPEETFAEIALMTPNVSGRMDNLRAAILRPQLRGLDTQVARWQERHDIVSGELSDLAGLTLIPLTPGFKRVGSSIQFRLKDWPMTAIGTVVERCTLRGVELKWFGNDAPSGYTSRHEHWQYVERQDLPQSDRILREILDMRLPLSFSPEDCHLIGSIIRDEVSKAYQTLAADPQPVTI